MNSNLLDLDGRRAREKEREPFHGANWPRQHQRSRPYLWLGIGIAVGTAAVALIRCQGLPISKSDIDPFEAACRTKCEGLGQQIAYFVIQDGRLVKCECAPKNQ
jgi:hypothetical protein